MVKDGTGSNTPTNANNVPVEQQDFKTNQSPEILDSIEGFKGISATISNANTSKAKYNSIEDFYKPALILV